MISLDEILDGRALVRNIGDIAKRLPDVPLPANPADLEKLVESRKYISAIRRYMSEWGATRFQSGLLQSIVNKHRQCLDGLLIAKAGLPVSWAQMKPSLVVLYGHCADEIAPLASLILDVCSVSVSSLIELVSSMGEDYDIPAPLRELVDRAYAGKAVSLNCKVLEGVTKLLPLARHRGILISGNQHLPDMALHGVMRDKFSVVEIDLTGTPITPYSAGVGLFVKHLLMKGNEGTGTLGRLVVDSEVGSGSLTGGSDQVESQALDSFSPNRLVWKDEASLTDYNILCSDRHVKFFFGDPASSYDVASSDGVTKDEDKGQEVKSNWTVILRSGCNIVIDTSNMSIMDVIGLIRVQIPNLPGIPRLVAGESESSEGACLSVFGMVCPVCYHDRKLVRVHTGSDGAQTERSDLQSVLVSVENQTYLLCAEGGCRDQFVLDPKRYASEVPKVTTCPRLFVFPNIEDALVEGEAAESGVSDSVVLSLIREAVSLLGPEACMSYSEGQIVDEAVRKSLNLPLSTDGLVNPEFTSSAICKRLLEDLATGKTIFLTECSDDSSALVSKLQLFFQESQAGTGTDPKEGGDASNRGSVSLSEFSRSPWMTAEWIAEATRPVDLLGAKNEDQTSEGWKSLVEGWKSLVDPFSSVESDLKSGSRDYYLVENDASLIRAVYLGPGNISEPNSSTSFETYSGSSVAFKAAKSLGLVYVSLSSLLSFLASYESLDLPMVKSVLACLYGGGCLSVPQLLQVLTWRLSMPDCVASGFLIDCSGDSGMMDVVELLASEPKDRSRGTVRFTPNVVIRDSRVQSNGQTDDTIKDSVLGSRLEGGLCHPGGCRLLIMPPVDEVWSLDLRARWIETRVKSIRLQLESDWASLSSPLAVLTADSANTQGLIHMLVKNQLQSHKSEDQSHKSEDQSHKSEDCTRDQSLTLTEELVSDVLMCTHCLSPTDPNETHRSQYVHCSHVVCLPNVSVGRSLVPLCDKHFSSIQNSSLDLLLECMVLELMPTAKLATPRAVSESNKPLFAHGLCPVSCLDLWGKDVSKLEDCVGNIDLPMFGDCLVEFHESSYKVYRHNLDAFMSDPHKYVGAIPQNHQSLELVHRAARLARHGITEASDSRGSKENDRSTNLAAPLATRFQVTNEVYLQRSLLQQIISETLAQICHSRPVAPGLDPQGTALHMVYRTMRALNPLRPPDQSCESDLKAFASQLAMKR